MHRAATTIIRKQRGTSAHMSSELVPNTSLITFELATIAMANGGWRDASLARSRVPA